MANTVKLEKRLQKDFHHFNTSQNILTCVVTLDGVSSPMYQQALVETASKSLNEIADKINKVLKDADDKAFAIKTRLTPPKGTVEPKLLMRGREEIEKITTKAKADANKIADDGAGELRTAMNKKRMELASIEPTLSEAKLMAGLKLTGSIGIALLVAGGSVTHSVASGGGTVPIAIASVGAALTLVGSSYTAIKAAFEDEVEMRAKIKASMVKLQKEIDTAKRQAEKDKSPGTLDKIKKALTTSEAATLSSLLEQQKTTIVGCVAKVSDLSRKIGDIISKQDEAIAKIKNSGGNQEAETELKELERTLKQKLAKIDQLNGIIEKHAKANAKAMLLLRDAKELKLDNFLSYAVETADEYKEPVKQIGEGVEAAMTILKELAK
jgi:hypothetical protein